MTVRTRVAPSPTGFVHIGFIHNALFAHALARSQNGNFILRIEDTDQKRFVEGAIEELCIMLDEFGLTPDEGPVQGGKFAPYIQSERMKSGIYKKAAEELVAKGNAYYCFLTSEELVELKKGELGKKAFRSPHRNLLKEEVQARLEKGDKYVIRLKVPDDEVIEVEDAIIGKVKWDSSDIDDQVLLKSDGFPTYHLAVAIDDHEMGITHVTRSYEWLPSTPKQVLLYKYLGFEMPIFAHSSLVLDPDGGKLSKRKGNVSAKQFLVEGYLPAAILNFLMLLGWAPPIVREHGQKEQELFTHDEFIKIYKLEDRQKTNAVFNRQKLLWFNQQYIQKIDAKELAKKFVTWIEKYSADQTLLEQIKNDNKLDVKIKLVQQRAHTYVEMLSMIQFFYSAPDKIDLEIKEVQNLGTVVKELNAAVEDVIEGLPDDEISWTNDSWANQMKSLAEKFQLKTGDPFMVLRIAVVGGPFSPPLFECIQILGKKEVLKRIKNLENQIAKL